MTKTRSSWYKDHRGGLEKVEGASVSLAALKEMSSEPAVASVLSVPPNIFTFKWRAKNSTEGFSRWRTCFHFTPDRLCRELS